MTGHEIAYKYIGLHEAKNNEQIREFLKKYSVKGDIAIDPANTAWCAAFVNACERASGNTGNGKLNARSFLTYGTMVYDKDKKLGNYKQAIPGDIVIFERGGSTWQGHVAYFRGFDKSSDGKILVRTLGGNQSDSVSVGWYDVRRLLGVRRP